MKARRISKMEWELRLRNEAPEFYKRFKDGEFVSVQKAAEAAGLKPVTGRGNSKAYWLERLQREAPAVYQQCLDDPSMSVQRAAKEAGIKRKYITHMATPYDFCRAAWRLSDGELRELIDRLEAMGVSRAISNMKYAARRSAPEPTPAWLTKRLAEMEKERERTTGDMSPARPSGDTSRIESDEERQRWNKAYWQSIIERASKEK